MSTIDIDERIKEFRNYLHEILEKRYECNKFASEKDVINLVNPQQSASCRGVYIFFDKNSKECIYVGKSGCKDSNLARLPVRIFKQFNNPMNGGNMGYKFRKKLSWTQGKIKRFTREEMSFCYKVLDNCDEVNKFEHFCIGVLSPILND